MRRYSGVNPQTVLPHHHQHHHNHHQIPPTPLPGPSGSHRQCRSSTAPSTPDESNPTTVHVIVDNLIETADAVEEGPAGETSKAS